MGRSTDRSINWSVNNQSLGHAVRAIGRSVYSPPPTLNDMHRDFTKQYRVTMKKHGTCEPTQTLFLKSHQPTTKLGSRLASRLPISGCRLVVSWALLCRCFMKCREKWKSDPPKFLELNIILTVGTTAPECTPQRNDAQK